MDGVTAGAVTRMSSRHRAVDWRAVATWTLAAGLVLYLAFDGGGYDLVVRSRAGIVVWWLVIVGAVCGLLPAGRLARASWLGLGLLSGFVVWTALATTWSISSERSLEELSRVAAYLGIFVLAVTLHRERERAVRHTVSAIAFAVAFVAAVALISRLRPGTFAGALTTNTLVPGAGGRLAWPLNYWNALGALVALGLPLLLSVATTARRLSVQALAAAAIAPTALCGYLTFSRAGAAAVAVGLIVWIALAPERIPKLATIAVCAAGSATLIAAAVHRAAIEKGLSGAEARHEGQTLLIAIVLVCVGTALAQTGIGLAARHGTLPRWLRVTRRQSIALLAVAVAAALVVAIAAGAPHRLRHAWDSFKRPAAQALSQDQLGRFSVASGNGRYQYWKAAISSMDGHVLTGSGPGTFQLLWLPRAPFYNYVRNAHSLYVETLAEVGVIGFLLLAGFLLVCIAAAARRTRQGSTSMRVRVAGVTAACCAFAVSAAFDWVWQVPVLPAAVLMLLAAALTPIDWAPFARGRRPATWGFRAALAVAGIASLVAIGVPLAVTQAVRQSQAEARAGNTPAALADAAQAARLEPGAESPPLQTALVLEAAGDLRGAIAAAEVATINERQNWQPWLILSRLDAEAQRPIAALAAFDRARALNPRSPLFHT